MDGIAASQPDIASPDHYAAVHTSECLSAPGESGAPNAGTGGDLCASVRLPLGMERCWQHIFRYWESPEMICIEGLRVRHGDRRVVKTSTAERKRSCPRTEHAEQRTTPRGAGEISGEAEEPQAVRQLAGKHAEERAKDPGGQAAASFQWAMAKISHANEPTVEKRRWARMMIVPGAAQSRQIFSRD